MAKVRRDAPQDHPDAIERASRSRSRSKSLTREIVASFKEFRDKVTRGRLVGLFFVQSLSVLSASPRRSEERFCVCVCVIYNMFTCIYNMFYIIEYMN